MGVGLMTTAPSAFSPPAAADPAGLPPTIGVDPGQTWTAAVLRVGDYAAYGWTMGPTAPSGEVLRGALNDPDNWIAFARYTQRLTTALDELVAYAHQEYGEVRIGIETPVLPIGYRTDKTAGHPKFQRLAPKDWIVTRQVAAAVLGAYPTARVVTPDKLGRRPAAEYPRELRGTRPPHWGPNEYRNGERDHERAAYDIAGLAARMPR